MQDCVDIIQDRRLSQHVQERCSNAAAGISAIVDLPKLLSPKARYLSSQRLKPPLSQKYFNQYV